MVETHMEFMEELRKVIENSPKDPTHFIIGLPYWDSMIKDFAKDTNIRVTELNSMYMGLEPIIVGWNDVDSCSNNVRKTLIEGGVVFLRLPGYGGLIRK